MILEKLNTCVPSALRDTFFSIAENSINGIISSYKYLGPAGQTEDGLFITRMDAVFRQIDGEEEPDIEEVDTATQWLLSHALAVAKGANQEEGPLQTRSRSVGSDRTRYTRLV